MQKLFLVLYFGFMIMSLLFRSTIVYASDESIYLQNEELHAYSLFSFDPTFVDWQRLNQFMKQIEEQIYIEPVDATLGKSGEIIEEIVGTGLDRHTFTERFLVKFYQDASGELAIPTKQIHARVDQEMLQQLMEKRLGSYTTVFNAKNKERTTNIELAAEAIHGTVIFPGEVFSFNETVGERTAEKGYERAPVIVKGEFAEDIGGGICQVSSTLFNAVDLRGIQMIERYTHSRTVPYVPPNRDATVSWWGPDFSFKNLYNEPVVITAKAVDGYLTTEIYSSAMVEFFRAE